MCSNSEWPSQSPEITPASLNQEMSSLQDRVEPPPALMSTVVNAGAENPPWTAIDLFIAACIFAMTIFASSMILLVLTIHGTGMSAAESAKNPSVESVVLAMTLGYVAMLATIYFRATSSKDLQFWKAIAWHWPRGRVWIAWLAAGAVLALGLGFLSRLLPFPKSLPMQRFFRDPQAAYLMMFMGVAIAPISEEISFRGFLYPVLDRWLQTLFMARQQLFNASKWLVLAAGWGYLIHRLAHLDSLGGGLASAVSLLVTLLAFLATGILFFFQWVRGKRFDVVLLAGLSLGAWGMASRSVPEWIFTLSTSAFLGLAVILAVAGFSRALSPVVAGRIGRILAIVTTSAAFAMVHGEQLGQAWGPLLVIFIVGMVLTVVRVATRSVAPGFLIHMAYNFTLFSGLYLASDHFRHLERINQ